MSALLAWAFPYLTAAGAALLAGLAAYFQARRAGARAAQIEAKENDHAKARAIEDAADRARRADDAGADPLERLRDAGRLRD